MAHHVLVNSLYDEFHSAAQRERDLHSQIAQYQNQLVHLRQTPNMAGPNTETHADAPRPATEGNDDLLHAKTIEVESLRQQLWVLEQNTIRFNEGAAQRTQHFNNDMRHAHDLNHNLENNVAYLVKELNVANSYNRYLHAQCHQLQIDSAETKRQLAAANKARSSSAAAQAPVQPLENHREVDSKKPLVAAAPAQQSPAITQALVQPLQDTRALLDHSQTTIRSLRAEIISLQASKKELQDSVLRLGEAPAPDSKAFFQGAALPRHVQEEWSEVLLGKDKEIAGLRLMVEREREMREQAEKERPAKCAPVVLDLSNDTE